MSWKPSDPRGSRPSERPEAGASSPPFSSARPRSTTINIEGRRLLEGVSLDPALSSGARNVVDAYLRVGRGERVALVYDASEEAIARALLEALNELSAVVTVHILSTHAPESESFAARVEMTLVASDAAIYVFGDPPRANSARARWIASGRGARHVLLVGVSHTVAMQSLRANPHELVRISERVATRVAAASSVEIATVTGTKLLAGLALSDAVRVEDGRVGEGLPVPILPAGEVLRACSRLDGDLVADGGIWLDPRTVFGLALRLVLRFVDGRLSEVRGLESERLVALIEQSGIEPTVAAIGFGTNPTVLTPVRELAQDMRMPGAHIVLGRLRDLADVGTPRLHLLVRRPDVRLDGATLMVNGRYARDLMA